MVKEYIDGRMEDNMKVII